MRRRVIHLRRKPKRSIGKNLNHHKRLDHSSPDYDDQLLTGWGEYFAGWRVVEKIEKLVKKMSGALGERNDPYSHWHYW